MDNKRLLKKIHDAALVGSYGPIKIYNRSQVIIPECAMFTFLVHNGIGFDKITISYEMIGRKFGEFSSTKRPVKHKHIL